MSIQKTNVLYVNFCLAMGGIETMIVGFTRYLQGSEFNTSAAVFEGGGCLEKPLRDNGIAVHNLDKKSGIDIGLIFRLRRLIKANNIQVVHTNNFATWLYTSLATTGMRGVRTVHTEHSTVRGHKKRRYLAERLLVSLTDGVVTVSQKVKDNMVELCGVSPERVEVITNGIDTDLFQPDESTRLEVREALGYGKEIVAFGTVGRVVPVKDHVSYVKAFAKVVNENPNARLILVGNGDSMQEVESEVEKLNIQSFVQLLGERHDIPDLLKAMDVYVVSSLSEGMSISMLEAMSTRLPIIATNVGGNPELVTDRDNGLLVPVSDVEAMAKAMSMLASNGTLRREYAISSRERVDKDFSNRSMMERYQSLYKGH